MRHSLPERAPTTHVELPLGLHVAQREPGAEFAGGDVDDQASGPVTTPLVPASAHVTSWRAGVS
jgi:hypothetical protein